MEQVCSGIVMQSSDFHSTPSHCLLITLHLHCEKPKALALAFTGAGVGMVQWVSLIIWRVLERRIAGNSLILFLELLPSSKVVVYVDFLYCWWDEWEYSSERCHLLK